MFVFKRLFKGKKHEKEVSDEEVAPLATPSNSSYRAVTFDDNNVNASADANDDTDAPNANDDTDAPNEKVQIDMNVSTDTQESNFESFESFEKSSSALKFAAIAFAFYYLVGAIAFRCMFEDWTIIDSAYMASVTFTTCGYGDLTPSEDGPAELAFMIFFVGFGVLVLATLAFNLIFENIFDGYDSALQQKKEENQKEFMKGMTHENSRGLVGSDSESSMDTTEKTMLGKMVDVIISVTPLFIILFLGTTLVGKVEGWGVMKSLYFLVVTATSVGYGDVSPQTQSMRFFCIFFIPFSVGIIAETFGRLTGVYLEAKGEEKQREFFNSSLTMADIKRMDKDGDNEVSKEEFIEFMLIAMGKIDKEDWAQLEELFVKLDVTGDGSLSYEDIQMMVDKGRASMSGKKKKRPTAQA